MIRWWIQATVSCSAPAGPGAPVVPGEPTPGRGWSGRGRRRRRRRGGDGAHRPPLPRAPAFGEGPGTSVDGAAAGAAAAAPAGPCGRDLDRPSIGDRLGRGRGAAGIAGAAGAAPGMRPPPRATREPRRARRAVGTAPRGPGQLVLQLLELPGEIVEPVELLADDVHLLAVHLAEHLDQHAHGLLELVEHLLLHHAELVDQGHEHRFGDLGLEPAGDGDVGGDELDVGGRGDDRHRRGGIGREGIGKNDPVKAGGADAAMPLRPRAGRRATSPRS